MDLGLPGACGSVLIMLALRFVDGGQGAGQALTCCGCGMHVQASAQTFTELQWLSIRPALEQGSQSCGEAASPEVGSSRKMSLGAPMRPQAMLSRLCSPPEIPRTRRPPGSRPPTCRACLTPQRKAVRVCMLWPMSKNSGCSGCL